jgi:hypothetical protein
LSAETRQRILEAQTHFGLTSPALVEKDLYVVAAIRALAAIDAAPEDIDFKIVLLPGNERLKSAGQGIGPILAPRTYSAAPILAPGLRLAAAPHWT